MNGRMDDPNTRCLWRAFQAVGKNLYEKDFTKFSARYIWTSDTYTEHLWIHGMEHPSEDHGEVACLVEEEKETWEQVDHQSSTMDYE